MSDKQLPPYKALPAWIWFPQVRLTLHRFFVSKPSKARFEVRGFLKCANALDELAKTRIQVGNPCEIIDLAL